MTLTSDAPRVLSLEEILTGWGHGYMEELLEPDEDVGAYDGQVQECVWLDGTVLARPAGFDYCDYFDRLQIERCYNRQPGGCRIWTGMPSDDMRRATPWA